MKIPVLDLQNKKTGEKALPKQFSEPVREDIIKRAVVALRHSKRVSYSSDPMAGKRASVRLSKKRHDYRGAYGRGASRVPRKITSRRGTQINLEAAFAPGTVGGRRAHPPKSTKILLVKINNQEWQKAMRSALAASLDKDLIARRQHAMPTSFPFALSTDFEKITKAKDFSQALLKLGFENEIARTKQTTTKPGKGKMRGRKTVTKKGPLVVVSQDCPLKKAGRNLPGFEIVSLNELNAEQLAPGTHAGRLTLYTESALDTMEKEKMFMKK